MAKRQPKYEVFPAKSPVSWWYWRLKAANGRIVSVGAEPFPSVKHALRAIARMERIVVYEPLAAFVTKR